MECIESSKDKLLKRRALCVPFAHGQGADRVLRRTDLSECITGVVMVKIFGGVTLVLQSWGRQQQKEMGLAQVEEGVGYALTRPGLMTFPLW